MGTQAHRQAGSITRLSMLSYGRSGRDESPNEVGGACRKAVAGMALNLGDAVYVGVGGQVFKSTTAANYAAYAGVVVGGKLIIGHDQVLYGTGVPAANTGQNVIIQRDGLVRVVAGATVTAGTNFTVVPDTATAGRVIPGATAGTIVGIAIGDATVGNELLIEIIRR